MIKCLDFFGGQIIPISNIRNIRRIVRRIWMLILGLKRLISRYLRRREIESKLIRLLFVDQGFSNMIHWVLITSHDLPLITKQ